MEKMRLGKTGLMVSRLGFGGIPIQRCSEDEAVKVVTRCLDAGITFLDTAAAYTTSEKRIGRAVAGRRQGLVLATKTQERTRETMEKQLLQSLASLGTDYLDLYQLHSVSDFDTLKQVTGPSGPLAWLAGLKRQGVIRHLGITSHSLPVAKEAVKTGLFETLMYGFNFMTAEPALELLPLVREQDMGFIAMKPMNGGMLDHPAPALKYLFQYPDVLPIIGLENTREVEEVIQIFQGDWKLTSAEQAEIDRMRKELGDRFCRRCDYCQPCQQGIKMSTVAFMRGMLKRFPPETVYSGRMNDLMATAGNCTECGECEPRCPYHLPIRDILKEELDWYQRQRNAWLATQAKPKG
jgi:predicted aldo/keto reductase-like oxidoreductase